MNILGEPLFSRDATGRLKSRVGTVFLRTPGLVTLAGIHAMQRLAWIKELNRMRKAARQPELGEDEVNDEMANSVDLLFDDEFVLIRPDPCAMALAFEADELLQTLVTKCKIRFLNTQDERVRDALCARGENWRMSRIPCSPEEINRLIATSRVAINAMPIYFYNRSTGTRYLTLATFAWLAGLPSDAFRAHLCEIATYCGMRNRFGHPEVDIFPSSCDFTRKTLAGLKAKELPADELSSAYQTLLAAFKKAVPDSLQDETAENTEWRNQMCSALTSQPNAVVSEELLPGISPEFYMQIEWLPGARLEQGELIFDSLCDDPGAKPENAEMSTLCDPRAKGVIFNYVRERSNIEFINIGRIGRSLSMRRPDTLHRPTVYVVQLKETDKAAAEIRILRFQKWGVQEHLDEGKTLEGAILEAADYTDYVFDRRLGCRQLGMTLPARVTAGRIREAYNGVNREYHGIRYWAIYFERQYVRGCATDKIHVRKYADPEFSRRLARLLGEAAATNMIVGRAHVDQSVMFDDGDEVITLDPQGLPERLIVSDHTGTFTNYRTPLLACADAYADPVNNRVAHMPNAVEFAECYLRAFRDRFEHTQKEYLHHKRAFDNLFRDHPLDPAGSLAFRWQCLLQRLTASDAAALADAIRSHIGVLRA